MFFAEGFHGDDQLHGAVPVHADKLVVLQLDDISFGVGNDSGDFVELSRNIREPYRDSEDSGPLDETVLYNGGQGDDVHVAAA